jgi:hypothetical protein
MAQCYWKFCHCPENQPCTEHAGFFCSTFSGNTVGGPGSVNDAVTRDAELAIQRLGASADELDRMRDALETKKRELEELKDRLERGVDNPGDFDERRAIGDGFLTARRRLLRVDGELTQTLSDLSVMHGRITSVGAQVSTSLIVPYSSATGYCECYREKLRQLGPIANQTNAIRVNELTPALAQRGVLTNQVTNWLSAGSFQNVGKVIATLMLVGAIAAYVLFSVTAAVFILIIGLLALAIYLLTMLALLVTVQTVIARARRKMLKLELLYYRLQNITTCQRPLALPGGGTAPPPNVVDENAWWLEGTEPPPPGD